MIIYLEDLQNSESPVPDILVIQDALLSHSDWFWEYGRILQYGYSVFIFLLVKLHCFSQYPHMWWYLFKCRKIQTLGIVPFTWKELMELCMKPSLKLRVISCHFNEYFLTIYYESDINLLACL
jgi:hypothetical protein